MDLKSSPKVVRDDDIIITVDADNTHNLKSVEFMIKRIDEGYEVVIGSCFSTGGMMIGVPVLTIYFELRQQSGLPIAFPRQRNSNLYRFYRAHSGAAR